MANEFDRLSVPFESLSCESEELSELDLESSLLLSEDSSEFSDDDWTAALKASGYSAEYAENVRHNAVFVNDEYNFFSRQNYMNNS